ncbi:HD domain-containing protein [bacterium]|nr:HD domain-containing protein [bacterium]
MNRFLESASFAAKEHGKINQKRKSGDLPYIVHPGQCYAVADALGEFNDSQLIAFWIHDVVEDTPVTINEIEDKFGEEVRSYVEGLTNAYTHQAFPEHNRKQRKSLENERLAKLPLDIKAMKIIDRGINIRDFRVCDDPSWMSHYMKETISFTELVVRPFEDELRGTYPKTLDYYECSIAIAENELQRL